MSQIKNLIDIFFGKKQHIKDDRVCRSCGGGGVTDSCSGVEQHLQSNLFTAPTRD